MATFVLRGIRHRLQALLVSGQTEHESNVPSGVQKPPLGYAMTLAMSATRTKHRWVVYERREGEFIILSQHFTTRAQAEKERDKLQAAFKSKWVSLGVGVVPANSTGRR